MPPAVEQKKIPAPGSCTHAYPARRLGSLRRPVFVDLETHRFRKLYQIAQSKSTVEKWDNYTLSAGPGECSFLNKLASTMRDRFPA